MVDIWAMHFGRSVVISWSMTHVETRLILVWQRVLQLLFDHSSWKLEWHEEKLEAFESRTFGKYKRNEENLPEASHRPDAETQSAGKEKVRKDLYTYYRRNESLGVRSHCFDTEVRWGTSERISIASELRRGISPFPLRAARADWADCSRDGKSLHRTS